MKPHYTIPIQDCGEPLVAIPLERFAVVSPHPYVALGAPYGDKSPYWLRHSVLAALLAAQDQLQAVRPGWQLQLFDAYRPLAVQQFMVDYTYRQLAQQQGRSPDTLTPQQQAQLRDQVYQFWAPPSPNPATPPPHSTGAAVDLTLVDERGQTLDMGSEIDEISDRAYPRYYRAASDAAGQQYHRDRALLAQVMAAAGFAQHPNEWWHFSLGDQLWAWQRHQPVARYGGTAATAPYSSVSVGC